MPRGKTWPFPVRARARTRQLPELPHGSNQHALLVAPVPMLCQQCHSHVRHPNDLLTAQSLGTGAAPDERLMGRGCLSCHAQIHGSNNPSGPRLHK
nr:cytochrome c3 family protein [Lysobacter sp. H23M47]